MNNKTIEDLFKTELMNDETILWVGQPDPRKVFTRLDLFLVPITTLWCGFAIYWEFRALLILNQFHRKQDFFSPVFGFLFVMIGLYLAVGRFFYKKWQKQKTYYALTNQRVLLWYKSSQTTKFQELWVEQISSIHKSIDSKGIGTILFGNNPMFGSFYGNTGLDFLTSQYQETLAFYDIPDAQETYKLINDLWKVKNKKNQEIYAFDDL